MLKNTLFTVLLKKYQCPFLKDGKILRGKEISAKIKYDNNYFWITNKRAMRIKTPSGIQTFSIEKATSTLPFSITLNHLTVHPKDKFTGVISILSDSVERSYAISKKIKLFIGDFKVEIKNIFPVGHNIFGIELQVNQTSGKPIQKVGIIIFLLGLLVQFLTIFIRRYKQN